jgi:lysophospholipase L1-like esterase
MREFLLGLRPRQIIAGLRPRQIIAGLRPRQTIAIFAGLVLSVPAHAFDPSTVVFIGSSTVEFWKTLERDFKPAHTLNLGVGGTTYEYLLLHAEEYASKYPARRFVVYSGDNDLEMGIEPRAVADQFKALAGMLHAKLPFSTITLIAVKPSPKRLKNLGLTKETNVLLQEAARKLNYVNFLDLFTKMTNDKGEPRKGLFRADGLHMNEKGYAIWTKALRPQLSL